MPYRMTVVTLIIAKTWLPDAQTQQRDGSLDKTSRAWNLVYYEEYRSRVEASQRDREIKKKKSRKYIEWLIAQHG